LPTLQELRATRGVDRGGSGELRVRTLALRWPLGAAAPGVAMAVGRAGSGECRLAVSIAEASTGPAVGSSVEMVFQVAEHDGSLELELSNETSSGDAVCLGRICLGLWILPFGAWMRRKEVLVGSEGVEVEFEVRLDLVQECHVDIAVLGVPFDSGCSFRPGARFGPESIRVNSRLIRPYLIEMRQRPLLERQVVDAGDVAVTPFGIDMAMAQILDACRAKLKVARRLVLMGGDHTLSYPSIKAVSEKFGPVVLIHFDSHLDTFPPMYNQDVWHGSPFRKCWEEGLLAKDGSTHIGIRASTYSSQDLLDSDAMGIATLTAEDVHEKGVDACLDVVRKRCERAAGAPVYLSIDIDVLDPSVAPGTGTPEFGGLLAHQLLKFVRGFEGLPIVGADVVEVAPAYDIAGITAMAAANLMVEEIALMNRCMDSDGFA